MSDTPKDPDPILAGEEDGEAIEPACQIARCDRPGVVSRKMPARGRDEEAQAEFVCRYHHRILLAMKAGVAVVALAILVVALYVSV